MKNSKFKYPLIFLVAGGTYALIMHGFDYWDGIAFEWLSFLSNFAFFGGFMMVYNFVVDQIRLKKKK